MTMTDFKSIFLKLLDELEKVNFKEKKYKKLFEKVVEKTAEKIADQITVYGYIKDFPSLTEIVKPIIEKNVETELDIIVVLMFAEYTRTVAYFSHQLLLELTGIVNAFAEVVRNKVNKKIKEKEFFEGLPYA